MSVLEGYAGSASSSISRGGSGGGGGELAPWQTLVPIIVSAFGALLLIIVVAYFIGPYFRGKSTMLTLMKGCGKSDEDECKTATIDKYQLNAKKKDGKTMDIKDYLRSLGEYPGFNDKQKTKLEVIAAHDTANGIETKQP